jgi:hypothetical protein
MIYRTIYGSNRISEYLDLVYNRYILTQPGILTNYYNFDPENSIYDENSNVTYGTPGGELSGIRYVLIHNLFLPFGMRTQKQETDSQEKGVNAYDTTFQIFLPSVYDIRPFRYDLIAFRPDPQGDTQVFQVAGIEEATISNNPRNFGWYLSLKPTYLTEDQIHISQEKAFDFTTNSVQDINTFNKRLILFMLSNQLNRKLRNHYNEILNTFIDEMGQIYKGFQNLIIDVRPLIHKYFIDQNWLYFSNRDTEFDSKWSQFLESKNPEVLGLNANTPFNEEFLELETSPNQIDSNTMSLLDAFILTYKLKYWLEGEYNG